MFLPHCRTRIALDEVSSHSGLILLTEQARLTRFGRVEIWAGGNVDRYAVS